MSWWRSSPARPRSCSRPGDLKEVVQSIKWFFGIGPQPHYGRYTYWEKFDYFAVFWGVMIIGSTGLVLWFPEFFTRILPGWSVNVATIIHSDEALLAVGFIFTIHFFNTHFRPDKFPMDPVIFTGRMTVDELKYDKPGEYERLKETGELEEHIVEPIPADLEKPVKIFGFIALIVGLTLIDPDHLHDALRLQVVLDAAPFCGTAGLRAGRSVDGSRCEVAAVPPTGPRGSAASKRPAPLPAVGSRARAVLRSQARPGDPQADEPLSNRRCQIGQGVSTGEGVWSGEAAAWEDPLIDPTHRE